MDIKSRFDGRMLFSFETDSVSVCLQASVKTRADLAEAYLVGANLAYAYLAGANGIINGGMPDGWCCIGWLRGGWLSVRVGYHDKRLAEGRSYWAGKDNRSEILAALDYVEAVARLRGWAVEKPAKEAA